MGTVSYIIRQDKANAPHDTAYAPRAHCTSMLVKHYATLLGIFATLLSCLAILMTSSAHAQSINCSSPIVKTGVEVLRDNGFAPLKGKRIGLITNPSGVDSQLKSTIEILHEAEGVELVALFGPEHGVRGDKWAGEKAEDSIDPETGLPVYSLYGSYRKPAARMIKGLDALVYDIQDVGSRSYTFISTMGLAMAACAEQDIEFIVLDRPNPLGGEKVEGCYVEQPYNSFVSQYRIPYIYGLTPGEVALLINGEGLNRGQKGNETAAVCRLTVIPMEGWKRNMTYRDTGLPWVPTSPNIPSPDAAIAYSCAGVCGEIGRFLNIGIGYTLPFQTFAAEWIDPVELKAELESYNLPGIAFREIYYRPFAGSGSGHTMKGVQYFFTDYSKAPLTLLQFYVMQAVARLYPEKKAFKVCSSTGLFDKVCGTDYVRKTFGKRYSFDDIAPYWRGDVSGFVEKSKTYWLYR